MDSDGCVSFGNPCSRGEIGEAAVTQIDCRQRFAIFGLEVFQQRMDALTDVAFGLGCSARVFLKIV
jgi:hypothetical protein